MNLAHKQLIADNWHPTETVDSVVEALDKEASMAIAWGCPDSESMGYSPSEFIRIIKKQQKLITFLYGRLSSRGS